MMNRFIFEELSATARRVPEKTALVCGDERMSYRQFDDLANSVANFLVTAGAHKGDRIGIALEKSNEYICLQFGILKAGACYVPIDHAFPVERMLQIIEDCGIHTVFASREVAEKLAKNREHSIALRMVVVVDGPVEQEWRGDGTWFETFDAVRTAPTATPPTRAIDADLAYIMYTSGSTGKPKGVMITHRNILTFMEWCNDKLGITENDVIAQVAPFTFDISGLDTYNAVTRGCTLVVIKNQLMINTVLAAIAKEKITFISTVPAVIGTIVSRPQLFKKYDLTSLRTFVSGAAACPAIFMKKLHEFLPNCTMYNIYGPTEATIYCTYHRIEPAELDVDKPVSIGVAYENTEAYVVGSDGKELPAGEVGELILRGTHISPGYFNNPEKTAAAFKNFPILPHLNEKAYFTGDLAKKDERGRIFFLGRKDDMIKSRGYRIELNEIEIALSMLDAQVLEFSAVAVPDTMVEHKLYAAVVLKDGAKLSEDEIKAHCTKKLPVYMVPETVIFMAELPKTTSGKISRKDIVKTILDEKL